MNLFTHLTGTWCPASYFSVSSYFLIQDDYCAKTVKIVNLKRNYSDKLAFDIVKFREVTKHLKEKLAVNINLYGTKKVLRC